MKAKNLIKLLNQCDPDEDVNVCVEHIVSAEQIDRLYLGIHGLSINEYEHVSIALEDPMP